MAKIRNSSKSGLFLIELIIAIVFFALASAVCVQLFVRAHLISKQSSETTTAIIEARNAAECFRAAGGSEEKFQALLDASSGTGDPSDPYSVYFGPNWQKISERSEAVYMLSVDVVQNEGLHTANIKVFRVDGEAVIFDVESKVYMA